MDRGFYWWRVGVGASVMINNLFLIDSNPTHPIRFYLWGFTILIAFLIAKEGLILSQFGEGVNDG